jgi:hypothetical protein
MSDHSGRAPDQKLPSLIRIAAGLAEIGRNQFKPTADRAMATSVP